jgi:hypothetical protein
VATLWLGDVLGGELIFRHGRRVEAAAPPEQPADEDRGRG